MPPVIISGVCKGKIPLNFSDYFGLPLGITYIRHLMTNWQWNQSVNFWNSVHKRDRRSNKNSDLETVVPFVSDKTCSDRLDDIQSWTLRICVRFVKHCPTRLVLSSFDDIFQNKWRKSSTEWAGSIIVTRVLLVQTCPNGKYWTDLCRRVINHGGFHQESWPLSNVRGRQ